jgi:hypothetical protein
MGSRVGFLSNTFDPIKACTKACTNIKLTGNIVPRLSFSCPRPVTNLHLLILYFTLASSLSCSLTCPCHLPQLSHMFISKHRPPCSRQLSKASSRIYTFITNTHTLGCAGALCGFVQALQAKSNVNNHTYILLQQTYLLLTTILPGPCKDIAFDEMLALAGGPTSFMIILPPATSHMSPSQLPDAMQDIHNLCVVMSAQLVRAFFEARPSPVMHRTSNNGKLPPVPAPVVKPDRNVYTVDIDQAFWWYVVVRGYNVGVVQGKYISSPSFTRFVKM